MQLFFTLESYRKTYRGTIIYSHNVDFAAALQFNLETSDSSYDESEKKLTLPHNTKLVPRRPKKHCIYTRNEDIDEKLIHIQKCDYGKQTGHTQRTCKEYI